MPEGEAGGQTDLWTQFLDFVSRIVIPDWGDLVGLIPLALVALVLLFLAMNAYRWWQAREINRARIPPRIPAGAPPPGIHLPGPSRWPFVVPIGAALILFALVFVRDGIPNPWLLGAGLLVTTVGLVGWLRDAGREWRRTEVGADHEVAALGHGAVGARTTLAPGAGGGGPVTTAREAALEAPPGVHLPGPSPWPFFAPIAMAFLFFGLVFGPALIIGGLVMSVIAAVGWYRDAGSEYRQVEAGHAPEPATRDPEAAFPKRLAVIYAVVGVLSLAVVAGPPLAQMARSAIWPGGGGDGGGGEGSAGGGAPVSDQLEVSAQNIAFDKNELNVPAGRPITITFTNREAAPHNIAIYDSSQMTRELFNGEVIQGPDRTVTYNVDPLDAGNYYFLCIVHPNMNGTVNAQ